MKRADLAVALALAVAPCMSAAQEYDLVLRNGRIVDGTAAPWFAGDLAIRGDAIVAVGPRLEGTARRVIDVEGRVVAPGLIDIHTHARRGIFEIPGADNYARQGVTTIFEGPDGSSPLPIAAFLANVAALPPGVNFGTFFGHGSVREAVLGNVDRAPTEEELERMKALARQAMREGAFGMSTGLFYVPGTFARTDEVVALARVVGEMGGMHISHMRDEAAHVVDSVRETIAIGEDGHLPTQITHHKIIGRAGEDRSRETLRLVEEARGRGVDVTIDQYPYTASSTSLAAAFLPAWAQEGGSDAVKARLGDPATRARIREVVVDKLQNERGGGDPRNIQIASCRFDPSLAGKDLAEITRARGREANVENAAEVAMDIVASGGAQGIFHAIPEADVVRILASPFTMIGSDGEIPTFGKGSPHPRSYGTFVRVLGVYVREKHVLGLEEAVRRMTSFPAARLGLGDRGLLRPGMKADVTVFDAATVRDTATFERPHQYAEGVSLVLVNGVPVFESGSMTGTRPGRVLRGPATAVSPR
jgi:N-acyl-D-amino-acid deacylase